MITPVSLVFIHHTAMDNVSTDPLCCAAVRSVQDYHMNDRGTHLLNPILNEQETMSPTKMVSSLTTFGIGLGWVCNFS